MKTLKRLIIGVVALAALLVAGLFVALNLIDPNQYKENIQQLAKQQTGRDLAIDGDIGVSYFPWVGLSLGQLSMANAEAFGEADFVSIGKADVKVKLLPLLKKAVEVKTVTLSGLSIDLQRAADGTTNWQDLLAAAGDDVATDDRADGAGAEDAASSSGGAGGLESLAVSGVEITDASIRWTDAQAGTDVHLQQFNLTTTAIAPGQPFAIETDFSVASDSIGIAADVKGAGDVTLDLDRQRYSLQQLALQAAGRGAALPNGNADMQLDANIVADLAAGSVAIDSLSLASLGVTLNGEIDVTGLDGEPQLSAKIDSETFNPADVLASLGIAAPQSADSAVLKSGRISASLSGSAKSAELANLQIVLDDTTLNGSASLPDLSAAVPPLRFELALDAIDVDRYLPPTQSPQPQASEASQQANSAADVQQPLDLPLELIRSLDVDGVLRVEKLKVANLNASAIALPLRASGGVVSIGGITAALYEGKMQAELGLDARAAQPAFSVDYQLESVQAALLLQDLLQDQAPISGLANLQAKLNTGGASVDALIAALAGDFNADFTDGSLNGINIGYQLRRAKSFLSGADEPVQQATVKTDFSALHLGGTVSDGVVSSSDLDIRSPGLRIGGDGTVDLPQQQVNYTVRSKVVGSVEGQGGADLDDLKGLAVNIPIRSSFSELADDFTGTVFSAMRDDFKNQAADNARALAEAEAEKVKAEARAKAEAAQAAAREKLEAEKAEAERKLAEELARQQEQAKIKAEELKEKARDKLKDLLK